MRFVDHPQNNITLVAPKGHEKDVASVRAFQRDHETIPCTATTVTLELDPVDRIKVLNGGRIRVSVLGEKFPPMYAEVE